MIIEDTTMQNISYQPKTMAELLPNLAVNGIMSNDAIRWLRSQNKPPNTEKVLKPLTMAEIRAELQVLKGRTPTPPATSTKKKKRWNSSTKVDKKVCHTADGKKRNHVARKLFNLELPSPVASVQAKTISNARMTMTPPAAHSRMKPAAAAVTNSRMTFMPAETPKFPKLDHRVKKSLYIQAKTNVRTSGICNMPETPVETKPARPRVTIANKENNSYPDNIRKSIAPKIMNDKRLLPPPVPDTPISNDSWKSDSDTSFLQKEEEIHVTEAMTNAILDNQHTLENIKVSPPIFTQTLQELSVLDNSTENDIITCFDNPTMLERVNKEEERVKEIEKANDREESVIVSLCDMLNKASVTSEGTSKLDELLEVERQTEHNIKMIDDGIQALRNIRESQQKALSQVRKLIREKRSSRKVSGNEKKKLS